MNHLFTGIKSRDKILIIFATSILLLLFNGAHAWFLWQVDDKIFMYVNLFIAIWFMMTHKQKWIRFDFLTIGFAFLAATLYYNRANYNFFGLIYAVGYIIPFYALARSSILVQKYVLNFILKILCFILIPSMILHVIFLATGFPAINPIENEASNNYQFYNYIFLVHNYVMENYQIRFCSIFLEPGYAGTLFVFLLYANGMVFKGNRENKILTLALLFTLSLAGYVTFIIAWIFTALQKGFLKAKYIGVLLAIVGSYFFSINYNGGDNVIYENIFSRLETDDSGQLKGNNRNSGTADDYFDFLFTNGQIWTGIGDSGVNMVNGGKGDYETGNQTQILGAGYVIYIIRYGIISCILCFIGYLLIGMKNDIRFNILFLILIVLTFWQASYPLSGSWLIPYILGVALNIKDPSKLSVRNGRKRVLRKIITSN